MVQTADCDVFFPRSGTYPPVPNGGLPLCTHLHQDMKASETIEAEAKLIVQVDNLSTM